MKAFLVVVVLLVVGVAGLGFYRGWFTIATENTDHKPQVTITVDQEKIEEDKEKVQNLGQKPKEKTGEPSDKVKEP